MFRWMHKKRKSRDYHDASVSGETYFLPGFAAAAISVQIDFLTITEENVEKIKCRSVQITGRRPNYDL